VIRHSGLVLGHPVELTMMSLAACHSQVVQEIGPRTAENEP